MHAFLDTICTICGALKPTIVRNLALIVLGALISIFFEFLTDGFKRPRRRIIAICAFNAVIVLVASLIFFITDTDFLAVSTLALSGI